MKLLTRLLLSKNANTVLLLVGITVGILVLAVIFTIGPLVGYNIESAVTIGNLADRANMTTVQQAWNPTTNSAITNGTEIWQQNTPMLGVAALIAIVGVIIAILMGVARPNQ